MTHAHDAMLQLAALLASKEASGQLLTATEQIVFDIVWLDTHVSANGFDGWLSSTSSEQIQRALQALKTIGCEEMAGVIDRALSVTGIEPSAMSHAAQQNRLGMLSEQERASLADLDADFCRRVESCMETCWVFVEANASDITVRAPGR